LVMINGEGDPSGVVTMRGFESAASRAVNPTDADGRRATGQPAREPVPEEATMNELALECANQVVDPAMHEKILLRAAELVAMGWTRGTAARDATAQKVRSTAPQATRWCLVGAVDRALYELLNLDVYALLGLEVDAYDTAPCPSELLRALRRPLQHVLGGLDLAHWNDHVCPGPAAAEQLLREAAATVTRSCDCFGS
jgi:hypothetical protein